MAKTVKDLSQVGERNVKMEKKNWMMCPEKLRDMSRDKEPVRDKEVLSSKVSE